MQGKWMDRVQTIRAVVLGAVVIAIVILWIVRR